MPTYLRPPTGHAHGPDQQGWNRFNVGGHMLNPLGQCVLLPRTPAAWWESQNTTRAEWGPFRPCTRNGSCDDCPVFADYRDKPLRINTPDLRLLVMVHPTDGHLYVPGDPERGWESGCMRFSWPEFARLRGWEFDCGHPDGFWIRRAPAAA